ncbi:MAG: DNA-directed RNA polymerase subunit K [Candidatus Micrarchaeota archaeon]
MVKENTYTKYEEARLVGARALQLAMGAPPLIDATKVSDVHVLTSPVEFAKLEFSKHSIPMSVIRKT